VINKQWAEKILDLDEQMNHHSIDPALVFSVVKSWPQAVLDQAFVNCVTSHVGKAAFAEILFRNNNLDGDWVIYKEESPGGVPGADEN